MISGVEDLGLCLFGALKKLWVFGVYCFGAYIVECIFLFSFSEETAVNLKEPLFTYRLFKQSFTLSFSINFKRF